MSGLDFCNSTLSRFFSVAKEQGLFLLGWIKYCIRLRVCWGQQFGPLWNTGPKDVSRDAVKLTYGTDSLALFWNGAVRPEVNAAIAFLSFFRENLYFALSTIVHHFGFVDYVIFLSVIRWTSTLRRQWTKLPSRLLHQMCGRLFGRSLRSVTLTRRTWSRRRKPPASSISSRSFGSK